MATCSEPARGAGPIEWLRWLCVLPAGWLASMATQFAVGALVRIASHGGVAALGSFVYHASREWAFVAAGAIVAPRRRLAASIVLAVLRLILSLMTHIVGQHLAGNRVGLVNYTHFLAESAGLLAGVAYIGWRERQRRRSDAPLEPATGGGPDGTK